MQSIDKSRIIPLTAVLQMSNKQRKYLKSRRMTKGYFVSKKDIFVVKGVDNNGNIFYRYGRGYSSQGWSEIGKESNTTFDSEQIQKVSKVFCFPIIDMKKIGSIKKAVGMSDEQRKWIFENIGTTNGTYFNEKLGKFIIKKVCIDKTHFYCGKGIEKKNWKMVIVDTSLS